MNIAAPWVYLGNGQFARDCAVVVEGDHILKIIPAAETTPLWLHDTVLIPGLVNAHCHLDLSHLRGQLSYKGSFSGWIREVMALRLAPDPDAMRAAATELMQSGVVCIMDHVGPWSDLSTILDLPLQYQFFVEVSGVTLETAESRLSAAQELVTRLQRDGYSASVTPHSPYSLHPEVFQKLLKSSCRTRSGIQSGPRIKSGVTSDTLSIHCAESAEEQEYFASGTGKMAEFLKEMGATCHPSLREGSKIAQGKLREGSRTLDPSALPQDDKPWLAIHCNTVTDADIQSLKNSAATVVHCPRSHAYFDHPPFPLQKLQAAGIPIAIGTDSLASCPNMNFLDEMRSMQKEFPFLSAEDILSMATCGKKIAAGEHADLAGFPLRGNDPYESVLQAEAATFLMIGGRRVI